MEDERKQQRNSFFFQRSSFGNIRFSTPFQFPLMKASVPRALKVKQDKRGRIYISDISGAA